MSSKNLVILIGRVGQEPEVKTLESGVKLANFSLATSENYTNKQGEKKENTQWHKCVCFGKLVDVIEKYLHKGDLTYLEGTIIYREYKDTSGDKKRLTEIKIDQIQLLGKK